MPAPEYTIGGHGSGGAAGAGRIVVQMHMRNLLELCRPRRCTTQMGGGRGCRLDSDFVYFPFFLGSFTYLVRSVGRGKGM